MKFVRGLINTDAGPFFTQLPLFGGGSNINEGAVVVRGATGDTNDGMAILQAGFGNITNMLGVTAEPHTNSVSGADSNTTGTNFTIRKVIMSPDSIYQAEYDQTSVISVASTSGTTVTVTSLQTLIGRGYLYAVSGTGAGRLAFIVTSAAGSCVTKEATGWDATTKLIKILPPFCATGGLNATGDKLGSQAAAGGTGYMILNSMIEADSVPLQPLNPTLHSGLTGLNPTGVANGLPVIRFFAQVIFTAYQAAI